MIGPAPTVPAAVAAGPLSPPAVGWQRVDLRTIVVRPFNEILGFVPVLVGLIATGQHDRQRLWWGLGVVGLLVLRGLLHWATTRYRVTDRQVELRTGLMFRRRLSVSRDRLRTVESTAKFGHRIFDVAAVRIGTGQHDRTSGAHLVLDALTRAEADRLRQVLLSRARSGPPTSDGADTPGAGPERIAALDPRWLWYAPLTLSGLAAIGVLIGLVWRAVSELDINVARLEPVHAGLRWAERAPAGAVIGTAVVVGLVVALLGSVVVYVFQFAGYTLTREPDATLHVRRGLLTRSAVTIEEARLRGVEIRQPLLLRAAGGARCDAVTSGLRARTESQVLMPPGPVAQAHRVAGAALRAAASPTLTALVRHPRRALGRRLVRAVTPAALLALGLWLASSRGWLPGWATAAAVAMLPVAVLLGYDRYRNLGHALCGPDTDVALDAGGSGLPLGSMEGYLITRSGSLVRRTVALRRAGIIGWRIRRSLFQRRVGLITLTATTAAGHGAYHVLDVAEGDGLALAEHAVPGLLARFVDGG